MPGLKAMHPQDIGPTLFFNKLVTSCE
jgi:hypothetical protein